MAKNKKVTDKTKKENHKHMNGELLLTPEGHQKLKAELALLKGQKRHTIIKRIEEALKLGDLRENAEYHDAKEEQGFVEGRILELEAMLNQARVVEKKNEGVVTIGSELVCTVNDKEKIFTIVGAEEADPAQGKISHISPMANALLGHRAGDAVEITTPAGRLQCFILKIK